MQDKKVNREGERGFSLIEVLIAILILTIGLLSLAQMMMIATNSNALSGRMTASAALAKEQLELLKAAPFYTDPNNIDTSSVNPMLQKSIGKLDSDESGGGQDFFQYYDPDGQPLTPNGPNGAAFVVRWQVDEVIPPGGDGTLPLSMLRITVRCSGLAQAYRFVGDATLMTFRTANIG
jgi:prepilin-type N-terminal cleavage/methylation domain-containing protein